MKIVNKRLPLVSNHFTTGETSNWNDHLLLHKLYSMIIDNLEIADRDWLGQKNQALLSLRPTKKKVTMAEPEQEKEAYTSAMKGKLNLKGIEVSTIVVELVFSLCSYVYCLVHL